MKTYNILLMGGKKKSGFITEWTVSGDATARTITLPLYNSGVFDCEVNWGDGTPNSTITAYNDANRIHTYASNGIYQVEITGECPSWSFNNGGDKLKCTDIINWGDTSNFGGFAYLSGGFKGCRNLKSLGKGKIITKAGLTSLYDTFNEAGKNKVGFTIPDGLLDNCVDVTNMSYLFTNCTSLTSIPTDLFKYNTKLANLRECFCNTKISSIPTDLFKYNTGVTSNAFRATFFGCSSLTSLPTDLFRYNTNVSTYGFFQTFSGCSSLTSIPTDLFRYNTAVSTYAFTAAFYNCTKLTSLPTDLFRYNTNVSTYGFYKTFSGCSSLTSIPTDLFRYNTAVSTEGFYQTFYGCTKLQLNAEIFYALGEEATRFLNQSPNFTDCFSRDSFTGTQGTAPALWDCNFGTGTPTTTGCFGGAGNSLTSLDNYASIPAEWI